MRKAIFVLASLFCFAACAHQQPVVKSALYEPSQREIVTELMKYGGVEVRECMASRQEAERYKGPSEEAKKLYLKSAQLCVEKTENLIAMINGILPSLTGKYREAMELHRINSLLRKESYSVTATCWAMSDSDSERMIRECFDAVELIDRVGNIYQWRFINFWMTSCNDDK